MVWMLRKSQVSLSQSPQPFLTVLTLCRYCFIYWSYLQELFYLELSLSTNDTFVSLRSILSCLEMSIRRKRIKPLPTIDAWPSNHLKLLRRTVSKQLLLKEEDVLLTHFALVNWENYMGVSPITTPAGPIHEGFLMYKHRHRSLWVPAYFQLKAGVLYCYKNLDVNIPDFYFKLQYPHFYGCQHCKTDSRPHTFELQLCGKEKLLLAAANDLEASNWLQSILQTVTLLREISDVQLGRIKPCSLLLSNDTLFMIDDACNIMSILGKALLSDLVAVQTDIESPTICILEFESGEANSCSGDWILVFADTEEKEKFLETVKVAWEHIFQVELRTASLKDLNLWSRCKEYYLEQQSVYNGVMFLLNDI